MDILQGDLLEAYNLLREVCTEHALNVGMAATNYLQACLSSGESEKESMCWILNVTYLRAVRAITESRSKYDELLFDTHIDRDSLPDMKFSLDFLEKVSCIWLRCFTWGRISEDRVKSFFSNIDRDTNEDIWNADEFKDPFFLSWKGCVDIFASKHLAQDQDLIAFGYDFDYLAAFKHVHPSILHPGDIAYAVSDRMFNHYYEFSGIEPIYPKKIPSSIPPNLG